MASRTLTIRERIRNAQVENERPTEATSEPAQESVTAVVDSPVEIVREEAPVEPPTPPTPLQSAMDGLRRLYESRRAADERLYESAVLSEAEKRPLDCTTETLCGVMERLGRKPEVFEGDVSAVRAFLAGQEAVRQMIAVRVDAAAKLPAALDAVARLKKELEAAEASLHELKFRRSQGAVELGQFRSQFRQNAITNRLLREWEEAHPGGLLAGC